ncbi:sirohydrochlorin cobaltochelatase [Desulfoglaeba alkanexedens]|nr:sirohydrochlorin cobaltochelatase [Desulfoglaeba alkanexedens]
MPKVRAMRVTVCLAILMSMVCLFERTEALAKKHKECPAKKAVLLVAFGTSLPEAQKPYEIIEDRVRAAFPGVEVRWAYTSSIVRRKLAEEGAAVDSPETAMAGLMDDRFTHVAILSLHTIPGKEFHDLYQNARLFSLMAGGFQKVAVARPLLSSQQDMERVAAAMVNALPASRRPGDAVVFMGHGSAHHPADAIYGAMNALWQETDPDVYLATVDGHPPFERVLAKLKERKTTKAYLVPFMLVAGDHARNDMAGPGPDSWKSVLERENIQAEPVFVGTGEISGVVDVWLEHLQSAFDEL